VLRKGLQTAETILTFKPEVDAGDPDEQERYLRELYQTSPPGDAGIQALRESFDFAEVARRFRMIEDQYSRPVVVPWFASEEESESDERDTPPVDGRARIAALRNALAGRASVRRALFRALQPLTVNVHARAFDEALASGAFEELCDGVVALRPTHAHHYHHRYGLVIGEDIAVAEPGALMV
jgi:CRISPR-associated endonuclease/helicase Cas3